LVICVYTGCEPSQSWGYITNLRPIYYVIELTFVERLSTYWSYGAFARRGHLGHYHVGRSVGRAFPQVGFREALSSEIKMIKR